MRTSGFKYIWLLFFVFLILVWFKREDLLYLVQPRPAAESLDFNKNDARFTPIPPVVSTDEKVNIEVFERVHPAVVNISTTTLGMNFWLEVIPREGQGSGFIIDGKGYILTNSHVVAKAQKITVTMADGTRAPANLVGRDLSSDLAVIKISSDFVQVVADLGDSDGIRVGQKAIAIGNPFGLTHTLTTGIISALNRGIRTEDGNEIEDLIQTDAAINPGNSGGPLLNSTGEVIGINTAIYSLSGGYQGIGFAIPINRARHVATQLISAGRVARPWLGVKGLPITPGIAEALGLPVDRGVLIIEVVPGSPASQAGLRSGYQDAIVGGMRLLLGGDIIVTIEGKDITDMKDLGKALDKAGIGQRARINLYREGRPLEISVMLAERP